MCKFCAWVEKGEKFNTIGLVTEIADILTLPQPNMPVSYCSVMLVVLIIIETTVLLLVSQVGNHVPRVAGACFLPTHQIPHLAARACCSSTA